MSLLRLDWRSDPEPRLAGGGVVLRPPRDSDYHEWASLREESRAFLEPWEPAWSGDELSRSSFRARIRRYGQDSRAGLAAPFFILRAKDAALVGGINVSNIRRGVAQDCSIGYWMGAPYARQGYMRESLRLVMRHCLEDLRLHRLAAACIPDNGPSRALLLKAGFTEEGFARAYLRIASQWRDHVLYGFVAGDPIG